MRAMNMQLADRIADAISPTIEDMGCELVRVQVQGSREKPVVQIMAEHADGSGVSLDECTDISRQVSVVLDVEDLLSNAYRLEISSPGIDRPLIRLKDYQRHVGHEAKLELHLPMDGRKRFRGDIKEVKDDGTIVIRCEGEDYTLNFNAIASAKLVLTDALLAANKSRNSSNITNLEDK